MIPKFREWDKERALTDYAKGMSYGVRSDGDDSFTFRFAHMEDSDVVDDNGVINRVVMMSSGLNDISGNELYEGDIVRIEDEYIGVVVFDEAAFRVEFENISQLLIDVYDDIELIGNIYEDRGLVLRYDL